MDTKLERVKFISFELRDRLEPLLRGEPVTLMINDARLAYKKRVGKNPLLFIAPLELYGVYEDFLVVSLVGFGCEVVDINKISALQFSMLGLSRPMAIELSQELTNLFFKHKEV